jgi:hypothetical protein
MTNPTTPFSWQMPTSSDLVTDLPADFETFGQAVATSLTDLLGGTSGQVLSKASNTDMDFTWVTSDDANAIQNTIVDAKGDLIGATAADTPARLAVGTNGQVLTADSTAGTGLAWATPAAVPTSYGFSAGKNQVINGAFDVWQRGTTFTVTGTESVVYKADRWSVQADGTTTTRTISRQAFTPGTAPVAGYEGNYFLRYAQTTAGNNSYNFLTTRLENVTTFAGQTVTLSFWAKADSARTVSSSVTQNFGSGGSGSVSNGIQSNSLTTSWQRFTSTFTMASISGKTIGTSSFLELTFTLPNGAITPTIDFWGVQLEAGSVATAFQTATGTIQGELAACERYYWRVTGAVTYIASGGIAGGTTTAYVQVKHPTTMRVTPTSADTSLLLLQIISNSFNVTAASISSGSPLMTLMVLTVASGLTATTQSYMLMTQNNAAAYFGLSAEL